MAITVLSKYDFKNILNGSDKYSIVHICGILLASERNEETIHMEMWKDQKGP